MSRSYRKTPIFGNGGGSEKQDKRYNNRRFRRINKMKLSKYDESSIFSLMKDVSNPWAMMKDGKSYWLLGKDESCYWKKHYEKMMRK